MATASKLEVMLEKIIPVGEEAEKQLVESEFR
jgi:hypothetical protein